MFVYGLAEMRTGGNSVTGLVAFNMCLKPVFPAGERGHMCAAVKTPVAFVIALLCWVCTPLSVFLTYIRAMPAEMKVKVSVFDVRPSAGFNDSGGSSRSRTVYLRSP